MSIRRNWSEMDEKATAKVLRDTFKDVSARPNEVLLAMLYDDVELSGHENHENFSAYKIEGEGYVWSCAACGQSNIFTSDEHYDSKGGVLYWEHHESECG